MRQYQECERHNNYGLANKLRKCYIITVFHYYCNLFEIEFLYIVILLRHVKKMIQKQLLTKDNNTWFSFIILLHKNMKRCTPMLLFMMLLC